MSRVCVIGLDCLTPEIVFDEERVELPNLRRLWREGLGGPLESTVPPITVPAWSAMVTGVDPGVLGVYGFRDRANRGYTERRLASSLSINQPTLWTLASRAHKVSRIIGVPQTYPPRPLRGFLVSDGPGTNAREASGAVTYPPELLSEIERSFGPFLFDVKDHRTLARPRLVATVREMTRQRFALARAFVAEPDWDLFMMVDMGPDRLQHAFFGAHGRGVIHDYYALLDEEVGRLLALLRFDDVVLVVSDHGAQPNQGGFALNSWLCEQGFLTLKAPVHAPTAWDPDLVDWPRTQAWADGGFVGRMYLNVRDREPCGRVPPSAIDDLVADIATRLSDLRDARGQKVEVSVQRPRDLYRDLRGIAPDLMVTIAGGALRAQGGFGYGTFWPLENDTGPDEANHARYGVFIMRDARGPRRAPALSIYDVAPTVLDRLGVLVPAEMRGRVLE